MQAAFTEMQALEKGAIANPDENRMVGHYWLRNPALAPIHRSARKSKTTVAAIKAFRRRRACGTRSAAMAALQEHVR